MAAGKPLPVAMTIAGVDSGGGAGIAADLKTFAAVGVHGTLAVTSVTAQNTYEVTGVYDLPPDAVRQQIRTVYEDMGIDSVKTGMLSNKDIVSAVASELRPYGFPLVVDPVMVAKSGASLLREDAIEALVKELLPRATVVTPNAPEAERISGMKVNDLESAKRAAKAIADLTGASAVIVKGGDLTGPESVDVMYYDGRFYEYRAPRIDARTTHGTGCSFSAAIAGYLARGLTIPEAVSKAKELVTVAINYGLRLGKGSGPVNPTAWVYIPAKRYEAELDLSEALEHLKREERYVSQLIPEISMNFGVAIEPPYARGIDDVAAIPGRITRYRERMVIHGAPTFGASSHVARAILAYMDLYPEYRASINIALNEAVQEAVKELGLKASYYDRREEPKEVKESEGGSIPWGVRSALVRAGGPVDVIYDYGDFGKEPGAFVFGRSAKEVASKVIAIARKLSDLQRA
ncbi:MAG: bifunctional hydroxymethylpyrimidine kinase/phosphomethylpyrimidine kinase [Acidilobus sp.]